MWFNQRRSQRTRDELSFHRDRLIDHYVASGMDRQAAERRAFLEFGNIAVIEEASKDVRGRWLDDLGKDLVYGLRKLRATPVFTFVALATIAIAIGANAAVFSVVEAVLLRSLPVERPQDLRELAWTERQNSQWQIEYSGGIRQTPSGESALSGFAYPVYAHIRDRSTTFSDLFLFHRRTINIRVAGHDERVTALLVSGNFLRGLGVGTTIGRTIGPADDRADAPAVAVVTYGFWQRAFGGDAGALGQTIAIGGTPAIVVGVTARGFDGVEPGSPIEILAPVTTLLPAGEAQKALENPRYWRYGVMGRVKAGVAEEHAQAEIEALVRQVLPPGGENLLRLLALPAGQGLDSLRRTYASPLYLLTGIVAVVLLVACGNIAGLLLTRGAAREREMHVRLALGAGRGRLIRQLLTESVLLAAIGGGLGVGLSFLVRGELLSALNLGRGPLEVALGVGPSFLTFAIGLCLVVGLLCGVWPAIRATRRGLHLTTARSVTGDRRDTRGFGGKALIALQVALSLILLVGAGLFLRTLVNLRSQAVGFRPDHVLLFDIDAMASGYTEARTGDFYDRVIDRLSILPDVTAISAARYALLSGNVTTVRVGIPGDVANQAGTRIHLHYVLPRYLETMGIPLLTGRDFTRADRVGAPRVAIANQALARLVAGDDSPVGNQIGDGLSKSGRLEIVGVAADVKLANLRDSAPPTLYLPSRQYPQQGMTFALRVSGDPLAIATPVRHAIEEIDAKVPVRQIRTQEAEIDTGVRQERLFAYIASGFALLAVCLASLGIYGTLAYAVSRRTPEIGVRMALGAARRDVVVMILRESFAPVIVGIALGLAGASLMTPLVRTMLFELTPHDASTMVFATTALVVSALAAAWLPSRRASGIDPMVALRSD